ncbi:MAG: hypothetical protein ACFE75_01735 [Candidatus Hodarchaeota archaeon]
MIEKKKPKRILIGILFLLLFSFLFPLIDTNEYFCGFNNINHNYRDNNLKPSATWGWLNLTNYMINNTRYYHSEIVTIEGRLFYLPTNFSYKGYSVSLKVDGTILPLYSDTTGDYGEFKFDYSIPTSSNIYSDHKFEAVVNNPGGDVIYLNHFIVNSKSYSSFVNLLYDTSIPLLSEEDFVITGNLRYNNGTDIPDAEIFYYWLNGSDLTDIIDSGSILTDPSGIFSNVKMPTTSLINSLSLLTLKLNYSYQPFVDYSEAIISDIKVFSDIIWVLDYGDFTATDNQQFTLTGTLYSNTIPTFPINNRNVTIYFNGAAKITVPTASDGSFIAEFQVTTGNGTFPIYVQLNDLLGKNISSTPQYIVVAPASPSILGPSELPPFLIFSLIFFPILAGIIAVLVVFGIKFYKKQEKESRVVNLPLESKIRNLKILKDSGRLEESISYLFNAIYMDLINAKYGRIRNVNETIRDFAIVSVRELKLTPASIYPFIQRVEEIIYAKPFKITENDFYNTCELFSPIYFQLTGYNFVLNF